MIDVDTQRISQLMELEEQVKSLSTRCHQYKTIADKWEPKFSSKIDLNKEIGIISLSFGGKVYHSQVTFQFLETADDFSASLVLENMFINMIKHLLKPMIEPEFSKLKENVISLRSTNKW
jgi:hypothetical protein